MKIFIAASFVTGLWQLFTQLPSNVLLFFVASFSVIVIAVLFYEPACSRLIRIIKAFTEVQRTKER